MNAVALDQEHMARLEMAAMLAPVIRGKEEKVLQRRIWILDKSGNVVGETTYREVLHAHVARHALEIAPAEGVRPFEVSCGICLKTFRPPRNIHGIRLCDICRKPKCKECGASLSDTTAYNFAKGLTSVLRCGPCHARLGTSGRPASKPLPRCTVCKQEFPVHTSTRKMCWSCWTSRSVCKRGHSMTGDNLRVKERIRDGRPSVERICRQCEYEKTKRLRNARKAKVA